MSFTPRQKVQGTAEAADGSADQTVIAAQGANKIIRVTKAIIQVTVAAVGGGGEVALEDGAGGTRFFEADADAVGIYVMSFADHPDEGWDLTANTLLNITVDGAATTQATARCTAIGYVLI